MTQYPDSGLGESSPEPEPSPRIITTQDLVVPDSQSLLGSSSYLPTSTSSTTSKITSLINTSSSSIAVAGGRSSSSVVRSPNLEASSILAVVRGNESVQSSSIVEVSASQPSVGSLSEGLLIAATHQSPDLTFVSAGASRARDPDIPDADRNNDNLCRDLCLIKRRNRRRSTLQEVFQISEDTLDRGHPSQATTTDESVLSSRDPNSQTIQPTDTEHRKDSLHEGLSTESITPIIPNSLDSQPPSQPPSDSDDEMSDFSSGGVNPLEGLQGLSTKEKLERMREARALKKG